MKHLWSVLNFVLLALLPGTRGWHRLWHLRSCSREAIIAAAMMVAAAGRVGGTAGGGAWWPAAERHSAAANHKSCGKVGVSLGQGQKNWQFSQD